MKKNTNIESDNQLKDLIVEHVRTDGFHETAISFLKLVRYSTTKQISDGLINPSFILPAQGSKKLVLSEKEYHYDPLHYLLVSVDLPVTGEVIRASPEKPYLSILIDLKIEEIAAVANESKLQIQKGARKGSGLIVSKIESRLLDSCIRLVRLLGTSEDIPMLAPLIKKEIIYFLLRGNQRQLLEYILASKGNREKIESVVNWIKSNYQKPITISEITKMFKMSSSSLHHSFKTITQMSPIQYQKKVRLMEAKRLLLRGGTTASAVGYEVGYESPAQFSREYRRLFGVPPSSDLRG